MYIKQILSVKHRTKEQISMATIVQKSLHIRKACKLSFHLKKIVAQVLILPKP